jgi:hypothetical protein
LILCSSVFPDRHGILELADETNSHLGDAIPSQDILHKCRIDFHLHHLELPEEHTGLWYSNILVGVIKGALEMVQMEVDAAFVQDILRGDSITEMRVRFVRKLEDAVPVGED